MEGQVDDFQVPARMTTKRQRYSTPSTCAPSRQGGTALGIHVQYQTRPATRLSQVLGGMYGTGLVVENVQHTRAAGQSARRGWDTGGAAISRAGGLTLACSARMHAGPAALTSQCLPVLVECCAVVVLCTLTAKRFYQRYGK